MQDSHDTLPPSGAGDPAPGAGGQDRGTTGGVIRPAPTSSAAPEPANVRGERAGGDNGALSPPAPTPAVDPSARLHERELRLRELTDQALHLLDQLARTRAEARAADTAAREWEQRWRETSAHVAELRRHVRSLRTVRLLAPGAPEANDPRGAVATDVFLWLGGDAAPEERDRWLVSMRKWLEHAAATLVCPAELVPPENIVRILPGLRVLASDGGTPAQAWNVALAAARAPVAILLGLGAQPRVPAQLRRLATFAGAAGATLGDASERQARSGDAGGDADDRVVAIVQPALALHTPPASATAGETGGPSPRPRPPTLGLFESRNLRLHRRPLGDERGVQEVEVAAPEAFAIDLAAHARIGPFDEDLLGPGALHDYCLRARALGWRVVGVPDVVVDLAAGRGMLESASHVERDRLVVLARHRPRQLFSALASFKLFWELSEHELRHLLRSLLVRLPGAERWPEAVELLTAEGTALARQTVPTPVFERYVQELEHLVAPEAAPEVVGGGDPVQHLDQVRSRLRESFTTSQERRRALVSRLEQIETEMLAVQRAKADLLERVAQSEAELAAIAAKLQQATAEKGELERLLLEQREQRERLAAELDVAQQAARWATAGAQAAKDQAQTEHEKLVAEHRTLAARTEALQRLLAEREEWIVALLEEKGRRRLKLLPRLLEHERRFLAERRPEA